jgi:hypothetical protein
MQQILNVLQPAASVALLTLEEAKLALNVPASDTSRDAALNMLIEQTSDVLAVLANRVFVYETVREDFFDISNNEKRLYFSRWPVVAGDIVQLTADGVDILPNIWPPPTVYPPTPPIPPVVMNTNWVLEQNTGILYTPPAGMWSGNVGAVYSGGYKNPDEVRPALKQLAVLILRDAYYAMIRGAMLSGVRMIAHKQARVMYYPQGGTIATASGVSASPQVQRAINDVLGHFFRYWL